MAGVPGQVAGGRGALAQVVQQHGKAYRQVVAVACRAIERHHHVDAGINFRMIIGTLGHAEQTVKFGDKPGECATFT